MENSGLITNIILAIITFFSLIVSIFALTTWKRQLKAQNELETARKILISLYKVKQKVKELRNPRPDVDEFENAKKFSGIPDDPYDYNISYSSHKQMLFYYRKYIVKNSIITLKDCVLEGEIYWGEKCVEFYNNIEKNICELIEKVDKKVNYPNRINENEIEGYEKIINENIEDSNKSQLIQDLYKSFDDFEEYLKQFIKLENDWIDKIFYKFNPLYK